MLQQKTSIQALELESQQRRILFILASLLGVLFILAIIVVDFIRVRKRNHEIQVLQKYIEQNVLQRFLPPVIVQEILAGHSRLDERARHQTVTILFADLCAFTRATDHLGPNTISHILNDFFVHMSDIIFAEGGTIDKFIGDAIMVIFGAPDSLAPHEQALRAVDCARRMQDKLVELNREWEISEGQHFEMRIGIHLGEAVVGSFGGTKRSDYTVIGSTVNIASRIEALAEPNSILTSDAVVNFLGQDEYELRGRFGIRGLDLEMPLYRIHQLAPSSRRDEAS